MITMINGSESAWTPEISELWKKKSHLYFTREEREHVSRMNYFTPRPYRNEYDRGSSAEGFTYTYKRAVGQILIKS